MQVNSKEYEKAQWDITTKMDQIIDGSRKCDEEELKSTTEFLKEGEAINDESNDGKRLEGYWLTVFKNSKLIEKECDEPIIKHLKQIDIKSEGKNKDTKAARYMSLKLVFDENEHFENTDITCLLEYNFDNDEIPKLSKGCEIKWKQGKNITTKPKNKKPTKKQREKKKKGIIDPVETQLSLFDIFSKDYKVEDAPQFPDPKDLQPDIYHVQEVIEAISEIAGENSLLYYLDVAKDEDIGDEDLEMIDEDDDEDDDDESDEEETQTSAKKMRKVSTKSGKSKKSKGAKSRKNTEDEVKVPAEPNKEECKQN